MYIMYHIHNVIVLISKALPNLILYKIRPPAASFRLLRDVTINSMSWFTVRLGGALSKHAIRLSPVEIYNCISSVKSENGRQGDEKTHTTSVCHNLSLEAIHAHHQECNYTNFSYP